MPKLVDHGSRRREIGQAVWRVIRRQGIEGASVREVGREAGWSPGAVRHYFPTQSDLLAFAIGLVAERVEARIASLDLPDDPRAAVEAVLLQVLPLDAERRAENEVWLAFASRTLVDPALRARNAEIDEALRAICAEAIAKLLAGGRARPGLDLELEAERLHSLLDGIAVHVAIRPRRTRPRLIESIVSRHLDSLA